MENKKPVFLPIRVQHWPLSLVLFRHEKEQFDDGEEPAEMSQPKKNKMLIFLKIYACQLFCVFCQFVTVNVNLLSPVMSWEVPLEIRNDVSYYRNVLQIFVRVSEPFIARNYGIPLGLKYLST